MSELLIQQSTLVDITNAVRAKKGTTALIPVTSIASEIESIETGTGGGGSVSNKLPLLAGPQDPNKPYDITAEDLGEITELGDYAFAYKTGMRSIEIPNTATRIGYGTFAGCISLADIKIPNKVKSIGYNAFSGCAFTTINIPDSVTYIEEGAFYECTALTAVHITDLVKWCEIDFNTPDSSVAANPLYYAKNLYLNDKLITDLVIPDSITNIKHYTFQGCSCTSVTIPTTVTSIGEYAFWGCDKLTAVHITDLAKWCGITFLDHGNPLVYAKNLYLNGELVTNLVIPNNITNIKDSAFEGCTSLTSVTIPNSVMNMGDSIFLECRNLKTAEIMNGITTIPRRTFNRCSSLTNVIIPDSVTSIGASAFEACASLTDIVIPDSVIGIGDYAFDGCGLTNVTMPITAIVSISGAKQTIGTIIITSGDSIPSGAFSSWNIQSITLPNSIISIGDYAFSGCPNLTNITIPESVTSIGISAFENCTELQASMTIPNSVTNLGDYAFYDTYIETFILMPTVPPVIGESALPDDLLKIIVPKGTLETYRTATNWSYYADYMVEAA